MASRAFSLEDGNLTGTTVRASSNREYLDLDIAFAAKGAGDVYKKESLASVKQALKLLLMTNRTEKPFSPYFGANMQSYLFELADKQTVSDINFAIRENIRVFEPRINPRTVQVKTNLDADNNSLEITIIFQVINSVDQVEFTTRLNRLR
jgi:phage baseplate assembly protein W